MGMSGPAMLLLDVEALTYEHRRVYYDVKQTQELMEQGQAAREKHHPPFLWLVRVYCASQ